MDNIDNIGPDVFARQYLGLPVGIVDCNRCIFISITEDKQRELKTCRPHVCGHYDKRCYHKSSSKDAYCIYPCDECYNDNYNHFTDIKRASNTNCH